MATSEHDEENGITGTDDDAGGASCDSDNVAHVPAAI